MRAGSSTTDTSASAAAAKSCERVGAVTRMPRSAVCSRISNRWSGMVHSYARFRLLPPLGVYCALQQTPPNEDGETMSSQIDFAYPWWLSYGHLIVTAIVVAVGLLAYFRRWPRVLTL